MLKTAIRLAATAALAFTATALHAQYPTDSNVYKTRCTILHDADAAIQTGTVPPVLATATHGVPAQSFTTFAFERSKSGNHVVSCVLFYFAAASARLHNDPAAAKDLALMAEAEWKDINGQSLTMSEKLKRTSMKAAEIPKPALTSAQLQAVVDAAGTCPLTLTPPPPPAPAKPAPKKH